MCICVVESWVEVNLVRQVVQSALFFFIGGPQTLHHHAIFTLFISFFLLIDLRVLIVLVEVSLVVDLEGRR